MMSAWWHSDLVISLRGASVRVRRAIAQGSSEYNITILVEQCESVRALRAVHARFYLAQLPVAVGIVGPGLIGSTLLAQIEQQLPVSVYRVRILSSGDKKGFENPKKPTVESIF